MPETIGIPKSRAYVILSTSERSRVGPNVDSSRNRKRDTRGVHFPNTFRNPSTYPFLSFVIQYLIRHSKFGIRTPTIPIAQSVARHFAHHSTLTQDETDATFCRTNCWGILAQASTRFVPFLEDT